MSDTLTIDTRNAFETHVLSLLADVLCTSIQSSDHPMIGRGDGQGMLPQVTRYDRDTIPRCPAESDHDALRVPGAPFPFDLFAAVRFWLTDEGNTGDQGRFDQHERLLRAGSAQASCGDPEIPIVNGYFQLFRTWLEAQFDFRFPRRKARIILSHDVDDPIDPSNLSHPLWLMGASVLAGRPRAALGQLRGLPGKIASRLRGSRAQHWNFEEIVELEASFGAQSAFYFAATPWWARGASDFDVTYDVRAPAFKTAMRRLLGAGSEVGLHFSYNARQDLELLHREKKRLERACGAEVLGGRHHYWHMKRPFWDTLEQHGRAGMRYDTSIGFNEAPGYRLGIAHPFFPWNPETQTPVGVLQIPTMLMDGALLYDPECTVEQAVATAERLLEKLAAHEGTAAIDWHVRTAWAGSERFGRWASVYEEVLRMIHGRADVEFCTSADLLASPRLAEASGTP